MSEVPHTISEHLTIERTSPVPLYHQLAEQLEDAVLSGKLQPGQRIENELELVKELELSRPTVRQAIDVLVRKGLLIRRRGIGTEVASKTFSRRFELSSLFEDLQKSGRNPTTQVFQFQIVQANAGLMQKFEFGPGQEIFYLERLRFANGKPMALMKNWMPSQIVNFGIEQLEKTGLYSLLRTAGHTPKIANQRFSAVPAKAEHAEFLRIEVGTPLLSMARTTYDGSGNPIEYAEHLYIADSYAVEVTVAEQ